MVSFEADVGVGRSLRFLVSWDKQRSTAADRTRWLKMSFSEHKHVREVEELWQLVKSEPSFFVGQDNRIIMRYLHSSHFDVEKAFAKMKAVYKLKLENPKWFANTVFSENHKIALSRNIHCLLKERDQSGRRVYVIKLGNIVIGELDPWENFQVDDLWLELAMDEPETQENGLVYIIDMKNLSWRYLKYFTPHNCKVASMKAEGLPVCHIEYHVVNSGLVLNSLVTIVFPFLSGSTKENIHFHKSNWASLHKYVTPDILPREYGGKLPDLNYDELQTYLTDNAQRLKELVDFGYKKEEVCLSNELI